MSQRDLEPAIIIVTATDNEDQQMVSAPTSKRSSLSVPPSPKLQTVAPQRTFSRRGSFRLNRNLRIITPAQYKELEEIFQQFDTDGSGTMEIGELTVVFWALGFMPEPGDVEKIVAKHFAISTDELEGFSLSLLQFLDLMTECLRTRDLSESLKATFHLFDQENKGYIVLKDIKRICKEINEVVSDADLEIMMAHIDKSGDGSVTIDEWIKVMASG